MSRLFKRIVQVLVYRRNAGIPGGFINNNPSFFALPNATEITDLRIQFKIEKSVSSEPNKCELTITNCNESTRADLKAKPLTIQINAGYDGILRHLFTGDLRYGYADLKDAAWESHLQLADGDQAYRYAFSSKSYKKGTPVSAALADAARTMGITIDADTLTSADLQTQFASGVALYGPTRDALTKLLAPFGYSWSIQNGKMQILKDQDTRNDTARVINEDSGMIGSPEWTTPEKASMPATLKCKCLCTPSSFQRVESRCRVEL